jgi:hypothetical protein
MVSIIVEIMTTVNPRVIKYFIKEAPVGELYQVLSEVVKITSMEVL